MLFTSHAAVFAYFTISNSFITGQRCKLGLLWSILPSFTSLSADLESVTMETKSPAGLEWPRLDQNTTWASVSVACGAKGWVRRNSECQSRLPEKTFVWVYIIMTIGDRFLEFTETLFSMGAIYRTCSGIHLKWNPPKNYMKQRVRSKLILMSSKVTFLPNLPCFQLSFFCRIGYKGSNIGWLISANGNSMAFGKLKKKKKSLGH